MLLAASLLSLFYSLLLISFSFHVLLVAWLLITNRWLDLDRRLSEYTEIALRVREHLLTNILLSLTFLLQIFKRLGFRTLKDAYKVPMAR